MLNQHLLIYLTDTLLPTAAAIPAASMRSPSLPPQPRPCTSVIEPDAPGGGGGEYDARPGAARRETETGSTRPGAQAPRSQPCPAPAPPPPAAEAADGARQVGWKNRCCQEAACRGFCVLLC